MERATQGQIFDYSIIVVILAVIAYIGVGGYFAVQLLKANDQVAQFHRSPGCVPAGTVTDPIQSTCTWDTYTVRSQEVRRERGKAAYHLSLSQSQGIVPDVEVPRSAYDRNPVGTAVQVETWGDIPVAVNDGVATFLPPTNPTIMARAARVSFGLVTAISVGIIGAASLIIAWTTRILVATKPSPESFDEPVVMPPTPTPSAVAPFTLKEENLPWRAIDGEDDPEDEHREDW